MILKEIIKQINSHHGCLITMYPIITEDSDYGFDYSISYMSESQNSLKIRHSEILRKDAIKAIKLFAGVLVCDNKYGKIWEFGDFKAKCAEEQNKAYRPIHDQHMPDSLALINGTGNGRKKHGVYSFQ